MLPLQNQAKFHFILNPRSGRGKGTKVVPKLESILKRESFRYTLQETLAPGEATEQAREASAHSDVVVAVGGDGTINEIASGLIGTNATLGIIPLGSGNDFAKMINLPIHLESAISVLKSRKIMTIDVGTVEYKSQRSPSLQQRYFLNAIGIGYEAEVAYESRRIRALKGLFLYLFAVLKSITRYKSQEYRITLDNDALNGELSVVTVGNGSCVGGGFRLTPYARLDDGMLDLCVIDHMSVLRAMRVLPSILKGKHGSYSEVHFFQTSKMIVYSPDLFSVHADGEVLGRDIQELVIHLLPGSLDVISN